MIAIIGASCCLPGGIESVQDFWETLCAGKNMASAVPADRWNSERFYHPDANVPGKTYMYQGHFVDRDLTQFDNEAFRISKREAEGLDPQQRLLLELTWQAMEESGLALDNLPSRKVGVYVGGFTLDYFLGQFAAENRNHIGVHTSAGSTLTMLSNRISHTFDFRGPSLTVDTACSSSLVMYHYACEDLKKGLCDIAVVGGVNLMMRPEYPIGMAKGGFLAKDGRSKSFDASGDGYGRGEGGVAMVLCRTEDAERDCNNIWAVHVASGINQDGRTPGITLPSGESQVTLMDDVLKRHDIDPNAVAYVEAHGTGTAAGDPIEADSINQVYGERDAGNVCYIGSAKSNVGHLEAGSGLVGVLKAALVAKTKMIPPIAGFNEPNPKIELDDQRMALADKLRPIDHRQSHPMVAVNSFGYGGTNAHIVLQHYSNDTALMTEDDTEREADDLLLTLTAASQNALIERVRQAKTLIENNPERIRQVLKSFTHHSHLSKERICFVARDTTDLLKQINDFLDAPEDGGAATCIKPRKTIGFVYTGMGPQWFGMGQQLYKYNSVYHEAALAFDERFQHIAGFSILQEMQKDEENSRINETEFAQPANLLIQVALTQTLRAYGIEPHAVTGHSVGDVAAAYASGGLSLDDAICVSVARSQLQGTLRNRGGMLAAAIDEATALELIEQYGAGETSIAAINGPGSLTLAGPENELERIAAVLQEQEIFHRLLSVEVPYHSKVMDEIYDALHARLANLEPQPFTTRCFSTVLGREFDGPFDSTYWNRNVRQPVRFREAIEAMVDAGCEYFLEVGPHPVLARSLQEIFKQYEEADCTSNFTLRRNEDEGATLVNCIKHVYCHSNGFKRTPLDAQQRIQLPTYPWDKRYLWNESEQTIRDRSAGMIAPMLERPGEQPGVFLTDLSIHHLDYLKSHVVDGSPVIPAAAVVEAALEVARESHPADAQIHIGQAKFMRTLALDNAGEQLLLCYDREGHRMSVLGGLERGATAFNTEMAHLHMQPANLELGKAVADKCPVVQDIDALYNMFNDVGLHSDELFQAVTKLDHNVQRDRFTAQVAVNEQLSCDGYVYHPTLIDGIFQSTAAFIADTTSAFIPVSVDEILLQKPTISPRKVGVNGSLRRKTEDAVSADLEVFCPETQQVLMHIRNLTVKRIKELNDAQLLPTGNYQTTWTLTDAVKPTSSAGKKILLIAPEDQTLDTTVGLLDGDGAAVTVKRLGFVDDSGVWQVEGTPLTFDGKQAMADELALDEFDSVILWCNLPERDSAAAAEAVCALTEALRLATAKAAGNNPQLTLLVENASNVTGEEILSPQAGAIMGGQRVAWSENEDVDVRLIDVDYLVDIDPCLLLNELLNSQRCDEIALRGGQRYQSLLQNRPAEVFDEQVKLTANAPYAWVNAGQEWRKSLVNVSRTPVIDGITVDLSAYGDRDEFAKPQPRTPQLIVGRREEVNEYGMVEKRVIAIAPVGNSRIAARPQLEATLVEVPNENLTADELLELALVAWGEVIVHYHRIDSVDHVLVAESPLGSAIACAAKTCGADVTILGQNENWAEKLATAESEFALMAVPLSARRAWFGFARLAPGGKIVNLDLARGDVGPVDVGLAIDELCRHKRDFEATLRAAFKSDVTPVRFEAYHLGDRQHVTAADVADQAVLDWRAPAKGTTAFASQQFDWDSANWMLVTGGLGGIGEKFIEWLVAQGLHKILIVGRTPYRKICMHPTWQKLVYEGVELAYLSADLTSDQFVTELKAFEVDNGKITSVAHLAGVIDDKQLAEMDSDTFRKVVRVKADGLNNVLKVLPVSQLNTLLAFSSIALLTGNSRQSNYCAANHYIENVTRNLRSQGVRGLTVHVGAIRDVGMIQRDKRLRQHIENTGLSLIGSANLFIGIKHALLRGDGVVTVAGKPNWEKWSQLEVSAARSPRFKEVLADVGNASTDVYESLCHDLSQADDNTRPHILGEIIRGLFAPILRLEAAEISMTDGFSDLGIDSLMATELQLVLKKNLGIEVSLLSLIGDSQSVSKLAINELKKMRLGA